MMCVGCYIGIVSNSSVPMRKFRFFFLSFCALLSVFVVALTPAHSVTTAVADRSVDKLLSYDVAPQPAETLSYVVQAGDVLILNLPKSLGTLEVGSYETRHAPAMSWLVDHAFFWKTLGKDIGLHYIVFDAIIDEIPLDQVIIEVEIR